MYPLKSERSNAHQLHHFSLVSTTADYRPRFALAIFLGPGSYWSKYPRQLRGYLDQRVSCPRPCQYRRPSTLLDDPDFFDLALGTTPARLYSSDHNCNNMYAIMLGGRNMYGYTFHHDLSHKEVYFYHLLLIVSSVTSSHQYIFKSASVRACKARCQAQVRNYGTCLPSW